MTNQLVSESPRNLLLQALYSWIDKFANFSGFQAAWRGDRVSGGPALLDPSIGRGLLRGH